MGIGRIIPVMPALFGDVTGTEKISDIAIWGTASIYVCTDAIYFWTHFRRFIRQVW